MRILYLDCFSGVAGDMLLGAFIDLGFSIETLRERLAGIRLRGFSISARKTSRQGITGTKFGVRVLGDHGHRGWKEIRSLLEKGDLDDETRRAALKIFRRLIEVEARIHGIPLERVHLHEVGAVDAIVDIVGSVIALRELLGTEGRLHVSPLHLGGGMVTMEHGTFPVPAPATAELVKGLPVRSGPVDGELVTPTGAAVVSTLGAEFGPMPPMTVRRVGYGAGTRQYDGHPNLLRAILGESAGAVERREEVVVVECNIDDMNPQGFGHLMDRLFEAGAFDVYYTPVLMKKNRPGTLVSIIAPQARFGDVTSALFRESTTIGLRHTIAGRIELARDVVKVRTEFGHVRVKVSSLDGAATHAQPEYEDCRRIAVARKVPLKEVQAAALAAFRATRPASAAAAGPARKRAARKKRKGR